jgi:hypothetical protein
MTDLIKTLVDAPTNGVLVLAGLAFLAVAVFGRINDRLDPGPKGRIGAGVLGAFLLVIGLLLPSETRRQESTATSSAPSAPPTATASAPTRPAPSDNVSTAAPTSGYPIALAAGQVVKREGRIYTILKMQLDENDAKEFALEVTARMVNEDRFPANFWNDNFRLVVDGVPYAPVGSLNEVVAAHAAKEGVVKFAVVKDAKTVALQIDRFGSDAPGLPIALPAK